MQLRGGPVLGENGRAVGIHEPVECGPTADLAAYDVDMTVTRRPATAADLARLEPPPSARPVRPGHAMHLMRQSTNPRSWRNYRSALGADAPAIEEEPVTPVTSTPPAIPCGTCLHEPVCALKASIPDLGTHVQLDPRKLADGLWLIVTGYAVDCDHHLPVIALRETTADRMAPPRIVPVASVEEPSAKLSNSARMQASRQRGGQVNRERIASTSQRYPLPRDPAERNRLVLAAVRETSDLVAASAILGVSDTRVSQILRVIRQAGEMPDDVADLLSARGGKPKAAAS